MINKHLSSLNFFFKRLNKKNKLINSDLHPYNYLSSFDSNYGNFKLKKLLKVKYNFFFFLYNCFKNIILIGKLYNFTYTKIPKKKINKIILTYGNKNNFNKNGSFVDKYYSIYSRKNKKNLIIINYLDLKFPKKIDHNLILINSNNKFNILFFLKNLFIVFKMENYKPLNALKIFTWEGVFAYYFGNSISNILNKITCVSKKSIILYEGQLFHLRCTKIFRRYKYRVYGLIHSHLPAMPSNLYYNKYSPEKIFVSGKEQKRVLVNFFNWKKDKVVSTLSTRFFRSDKKIMHDKIYLPINISFSDIPFILSKFELLNTIIPLKLNNFKICNHPAAKNSSSHINLIQKLNFFLKKKNENNFNNKKYSIFIGSTSAIIESLERGNNVVHIYKNNILDKYNSQIWSNIITQNIDKNIAIYSIKKKSLNISMRNKRTQTLSFFI